MSNASTGKKFLIVGATGNTGNLVASSLLSRGESVRCLVRNEDKATSLKDAGANIVVADLDNPESLVPAFDGIDSVFLVTSVCPQAAQQAINGFNAAKNSGVKHIVRYTGALDTGDIEIYSNEQHKKTDAVLAASGLSYTIIRPNHFMQNLLMAAPTIASDSAIILPYGKSRIGYVDLPDVAEAVVNVMLSGDHLGETLTITGPESISVDDVAEAISDVIGRKVSYTAVDPDVAGEGFVAAGWDKWLVDEYITYFKAFDKGICDIVSNDFEKLTGHRPRSINDFARDNAEMFSAEQPVSAG